MVSRHATDAESDDAVESPDAEQGVVGQPGETAIARTIRSRFKAARGERGVSSGLLGCWRLKCGTPDQAALVTSRSACQHGGWRCANYPAEGAA